MYTLLRNRVLVTAPIPKTYFDLELLCMCVQSNFNPQPASVVFQLWLKWEPHPRRLELGQDLQLRKDKALKVDLRKMLRREY